MKKKIMQIDNILSECLLTVATRKKVRSNHLIKFYSAPAFLNRN